MDGMLGKKLGMTQIFTADGDTVQVTVVEVGPCVVVTRRTAAKDGYDAVQLGLVEAKPPRHVTKPQQGHFKKAGATPTRKLAEFEITADEAWAAGDQVKCSMFQEKDFVDVVGTSKGKGFQGTMKRWNFKGMTATHGTERKHRSPGSIGGLCSNRGFGGGLKKGKKMSGQMGNERCTQRSLDIVRILPEQDLLLVKGPIPGAASGMVMVRTATRLYKSKAKKLAAAKK